MWRKKRQEKTRAILRDALASHRLAQPREVVSDEDSQVVRYQGWNSVMRVLAAVHKISSPESYLPALQGVVLDRGCINHRKREVRRPVLHLLWECSGVPLAHFERRVREQTERVLTKERGVMIRCHETETFFMENRRRLSRLFPVYMVFDVKGLCPSILKPGRLRRALARLRHPLRGYGEYPRGPGW